MKELELTIRVRNNRLKERREALGMAQPEFAIAAGVSLSAYRDLEAMRRSPRIQGNGCWRWKEIVLQLARFHCVEPDELFPAAVLAVENPVTSRRLNGDDLLPLLIDHDQRLLEGPDAAYDRAELREHIRRALSGLRPQDAKVLRLRFGLDDGDAQTIDQVCATMEVGPKRVLEIAARALRGLRHPSRARLLRKFHND